MGYMQALGMAEAVRNHETDLRQTISWHLTVNHFPPVPASMIDPCLEALSAIEDDDLDRMIDLPEGVAWRNQTSAPAWVIVQDHHLEAFIDIYEDDVDYEEPEELDDLDPSAVYTTSAPATTTTEEE